MGSAGTCATHTLCPLWKQALPKIVDYPSVNHLVGCAHLKLQGSFRVKIVFTICTGFFFGLSVLFDVFFCVHNLFRNFIS